MRHYGKLYFLSLAGMFVRKKLLQSTLIVGKTKVDKSESEETLSDCKSIALLSV